MNSYALVAFATPIAALLLGWAAVALHRRSLCGRSSHEDQHEDQAERLAQRERELEASFDAMIVRADLTRKRVAVLRAELDQFERDEARRRSGSDDGTALAR